MREYVASMARDLQADVGTIDRTVVGNRIVLDGLDSLLQRLAKPRDDAAYRRHLYLTSLMRTYDYVVADFPELRISSGTRRMDRRGSWEVYLTRFSIPLASGSRTARPHRC